VSTACWAWTLAPITTSKCVKRREGGSEYFWCFFQAARAAIASSVPYCPHGWNSIPWMPIVRPWESFWRDRLALPGASHARILHYRRGAKWAGTQCHPIRRVLSCGKGSSTESATLLSVGWKQTSNRCLYEVHTVHTSILALRSPFKQGYTASCLGS
jgi:hypothetical protein